MHRLYLLLLPLSGLLLSPVLAADKYALLIGVTKYQREQMNEAKIDYPEADAVAVREQLKRSGYTVVTLLGQQAGKTAIEAALQELEKHGTADGIVFIGLFGHGVQYHEDAWFCPWDTTTRKVTDSKGRVLKDRNGFEMLEPDPVSMISMKQLLDALNACGAGNRVIFADCCREDPSSARSALLSHRAFGYSGRTTDLKEGTAAMFSCSRGERSFEHADWGHGAFTKAFVDYCKTLPADGDSLVSTMTGPLFRRVNALVQEKSPNATQRINLITNGIVDLQLLPADARRSENRMNGKSNVPPMLEKRPPVTERPQRITNSIGQELVLIPAGSFLMGSPDNESGRASDEGPQRRVEITKPFYLGATEVTQKQWKLVMKTEPWRTGEHQAGDQNAAGSISWDNAQAFCQHLTQLEGKTYRLPTEAEWEYACRAGTTSPYHFGADPRELTEHAWYDENTYSKGNRYAHRVAEKKPNAFGLYDMHGNVWEWCEDWLSKGYDASSPLNAPLRPNTDSFRVLRGGSWNSTGALSARSANRNGNVPGYRYSDTGFRLVLD